MSKARAAQIWAQLERFLIERCGLPDGRMLERDRPELIRAIGELLPGIYTGQDELSAAPLPQQDAYAKRIKVRPKVRPQPAQSAMRNVRIDTIHDPHWAAMLERSCSRRMGYDGDDEVTHAGSR